MISIALAVYNGERFIGEQLDSFVKQTRLPDELVISDNASTDRTLEIVRQFAARAPFPVRLIVNDRNLGITKNFERAIRESTGDVIFLSDCDDVWYPEKIAVMEAALLANPNAGIALCDADVVTEDLKPLPRSLWERFDFNPSRRAILGMAAGRAFPRGAPVSGACMALRAHLRWLVLPFAEAYHGAHDVFAFWTIACSAAAGVALVPMRLLSYRQHPEQAIGARPYESFLSRAARTFSRARSGAQSRFLEIVINRAEEGAVAYPPLNSSIRLGALRHWRARHDLPATRTARIPIVLRELMTLRYHRFCGGSSGLATALRDLVLAGEGELARRSPSASPSPRW